MLQSMGVVVLEERPFTVIRPDGLPVWIYQFKISVLADIPEEPEGPERDATAVRFADAVTAIWHGRAEIDRFNELVLRAGLTWQQVAGPAHLREVPAAGRFSVQPVPHRGGAQRQPRHRAVAWSSCSRRCSTPQPIPNGSDAQAAAASVAADIDALISLDTDRVLRASRR